MRTMITGHRPHKLGGYSMDSAAVVHIEQEARRIIAALNPLEDVLVCGMAQGVDQLFAGIALELGIPVHAYVPFYGQESQWTDHAKRVYRSLLHRCDSVIFCADRPSKDAYLLRNAVMVQNADVAVAVWDGSPGGGTAHAIDLIHIKGLPLTIIDV